MMSISWLPQRRLRLGFAQTVMLIAVSTALGAGLTSAAQALQMRLGLITSSPAPIPAVDSRFITVGRAYLPELGRAYATAWNEGAKALESGQPVAAALKCVSQSWDSGRVQLFDRLIAPELFRIVADGQPESQVTTSSRQALARAWRGLASGLGSP